MFVDAKAPTRPVSSRGVLRFWRRQLTLIHRGNLLSAFSLIIVALGKRCLYPT